jgi:hypothetical protein
MGQRIDDLHTNLNSHNSRGSILIGERGGENVTARNAEQVS